jgi:hypothetical protein
MKTTRTMYGFAFAAALSGCTSADDASEFVGSWSYAAGSKTAVDCGQGPFDFPLDGVVETFAESGGVLTKEDSQGCAGLTFTVSGDVASLASSDQSCTIPSAGSNPSAVFAPSAYTFTLSSDGATLTASTTATYTPMGAPSGCAVTGTNALERE